VSWKIIIPEAVKEPFIATDQDYIRDVLIAYLRTYLLEHPDASVFRDYVKEEIRNLYVSGVYKQDIRFMPQITVDVQVSDLKPLGIGDVGYLDGEKIVTAYSQNLNARFGIYALTQDENRLIQSVVGYGFTNKWFRFMLYKYGIYIIPNSLGFGAMTTTSYLPDKTLYKSEINFKIWAQIQQEVQRRVGPIIEDAVPEPNWVP